MTVNAKHDAQNFYYSGQGVVMIGTRGADGKPQGLRPLGNCTDLKITVATSTIDHKGSQDGQRAIDKRLQTETKANLSMTVDNLNAANLAAALRGVASTLAAGSVTGEAITGYAGMITGFAKINVSNVVVKQGGTALTEYVDALTPYDYKVNLDGGSIILNNPRETGVTPAKLGVTPTGVTVGATTTITVNNTFVVGDEVYLYGFTGADAADLNGKFVVVTARTNTDFTFAQNTTTKVITTGAGTRALNLDQGIALTADYSFSEQKYIDALTLPTQELWMRFEGLNTAESTTVGGEVIFQPVIVEVFKFSTDPLKELSLISDQFGQIVLEGSVLSDALRPAGTSKFFAVKKLN